LKDAVRRFGYAGVALICFAAGFWILILILLPAVVMLDFAFRPFLPLREWGGPKDVYTLANFATAFFNEFNRVIFLKTIWASVLTTVLALVICYPISFILSRAGRTGWIGFLMVGLLVPFWINEVLRSFAWQMLLSHKGLINATLQWIGVISDPINFYNQNLGVLIGLAYTYILFMVFPMYNAMETLDPNQIHAARDLGASWRRVHWDIVIPHSKPGIASGCIVTFMLAAGSYIVPQLLGGTRSLWFTQLIYSQFEALNWNVGAAYATCLIGLCLGFVLLMMRLFRVKLQDIAR
jgi:spermidine/putrescine transport system permease protein